MSQLFLFGLQILFGVSTGLDFTGHSLDDFDAGAFKSRNFLGIIREQAHLVYAEGLEHLAGQGKVALVGLEAQALVGLDRIQAGILQLVRLQFRHKADASALLLFVNQNAGALVANHRQRHLQLLTAVTAQRMKNVTGEALRVNAQQRRG